MFQGQPPPQFPQQLWRHFYLSDKSEFHEKPQFYVTSSSQSVSRGGVSVGAVSAIAPTVFDESLFVT